METRLKEFNHYNNGTRSSDAAKSFLEYFMGTISTEDIRFTECMMVKTQRYFIIGCWTHCRRLWIDALPSDRTAMNIIDPINDMLKNEYLLRMMNSEVIRLKKKGLSLRTDS